MTAQIPAAPSVEAVVALQRQLISEYRSAPGMFRELASMESLLADTYRDRVQYELLQNSDDAGSGRVVITTTSETVEWANDGRMLTQNDIESLCRSASSTKIRGTSIGYRGIGFKAVAGLCDRVAVISGNVAFDFDRHAAGELLASQDPSQVPLIRVPARARQNARAIEGVTFQMHTDGRAIAAPDPLSLLFLRNVRTIEIVDSDGTSRTMSATRSPGHCRLAVSGRTADFAIIEDERTTLAVPMNDLAQSMTGSSGRLACFLPLNDRLGVPFVVSGDVLTDPSRTHAVVGDPTTENALEKAARLLSDLLRVPSQPLFQRAWELLLSGPDLRAELVNQQPSVALSFVSALKRHIADVALPFSVVPFEIAAVDVDTLFPSGAPRALYMAENTRSARQIRVALGLTELDAAAFARKHDPNDLADTTIRNCAQQLADVAERTRRPLEPQQLRYLRAAGFDEHPAPSALPEIKSVPRRPTGEQKAATFPALFAQWRAAEEAVLQWLNSRGWHLEDVSTRNLGYDLTGTDEHDAPVHVEVKKVDRPDARFSVTPNEMSVMQSGSRRYLIAVAIGADRHARLMLLDPVAGDIQRDQVCRKWEWEFSDWASSGQYLQ